MMPPDTAVKFDLLRNGGISTVTATLGQMPHEKQAANARSGNPQATSGTPYLGLSLAPANEVAGSGAEGVVVTDVDPNGPAAQHGVQTGNIILDIGGKAVANVGDVRNALNDAKGQGKHDVLMHVKTGNATKFVAVPIAKQAG
jgi:serine protease Do